jgi:hypothetical protein
MGVLALALSSIAHHRRPYGAYKFDWVDAVDRFFVALCSAWTIALLVLSGDRTWRFTLASTASIMSIVLYVNGAVLNMLLKRSVRAAWYQVAVHISACVAFVLTAICAKSY